MDSFIVIYQLDGNLVETVLPAPDWTKIYEVIRERLPAAATTRSITLNRAIGSMGFTSKGSHKTKLDVWKA